MESKIVEPLSWGDITKACLNHGPSIVAIGAAYAFLLSVIWKIFSALSSQSPGTLAFASVSDYLDGTIAAAAVGLIATAFIIVPGLMIYRHAQARVLSARWVVGIPIILFVVVRLVSLQNETQAEIVGGTLFVGFAALVVFVVLHSFTLNDLRVRRIYVFSFLIVLPVASTVVAAVLIGGSSAYCKTPIEVRSESGNKIASGTLVGYFNRGILLEVPNAELELVPWGGVIRKGESKCVEQPKFSYLKMGFVDAEKPKPPPVAAPKLK